MNFKTINSFAGVQISYSSLTFDSAPSEYQVIVVLSDTTGDFLAQTKRLISAYREFCENELPNAMPVFERYFLSDIVNQQSVLESQLENDGSYAVSFIGQPPLNGGKIVLWAWLQTDVVTRRIGNGVFETHTGNNMHLRTASEYSLAAGPFKQTRELFAGYAAKLNDLSLTMADNCVRTWFYVHDVDNNYNGLVEARNAVFEKQGLTTETHYIASTGIEGRSMSEKALIQMDTYAVAALKSEQIKYLYASGHLNRTSEYGVSFERGTSVLYGDRKQVFISGTASIDNRGLIVCPGDIVAQTGRMIENVEALLLEAECSFADVSQMIVYLRDVADYQTVKNIFSDKFPEIPYVILLAPVCRPGWLIEMECIALKKEINSQYTVY